MQGSGYWKFYLHFIGLGVTGQDLDPGCITGTEMRNPQLGQRGQRPMNAVLLEALGPSASGINFTWRPPDGPKSGNPASRGPDRHQGVRFGFLTAHV